MCNLLTCGHSAESWLSRQGREEPQLPGLDFSPEQMFWISGANVWCAKHRPGDLRMSVMLGTHTPGNYRIQVTITGGHFTINYHYSMLSLKETISNMGLVSGGILKPGRFCKGFSV